MSAGILCTRCAAESAALNYIFLNLPVRAYTARQLAVAPTFFDTDRWLLTGSQGQSFNLFDSRSLLRAMHIDAEGCVFACQIRHIAQKSLWSDVGQINRFVCVYIYQDKNKHVCVTYLQNVLALEYIKCVNLLALFQQKIERDLDPEGRRKRTQECMLSCRWFILQAHGFRVSELYCTTRFNLAANYKVTLIAQDSYVLGDILCTLNLHFVKETVAQWLRSFVIITSH